MATKQQYIINHIQLVLIFMFLALLYPSNLDFRTNAENNISEYRVESGDNLWNIAKYNNSTVEHIKILNNLNTDVIFPGLIINIPNQAYIKIMNLELKWDEAINARRESDFMKSITIFESLIDSKVNKDLSSKSQFQIADIYLNDINNYTFAIRHFQKVLDEYPDSDEKKKSLFMLGYICSNYVESYSEAISYYNMFLSLYPEDELSYSVKYELDLLDSLGIPQR